MKVVWIILDYLTISKKSELIWDFVVFATVFLFCYFGFDNSGDNLTNSIGNVSQLSGVVIGVSLALFGFLLSSDSDVVKMAKLTKLKKRNINDGELTMYGLLLIYISYSLLLQFILVFVDIILYIGSKIFIRFGVEEIALSFIAGIFVCSLLIVLRGVVAFYNVFFYPDKSEDDAVPKK